MRCKVCGEESFARKKVKTENFKVVEEFEVCAVCGEKWQRDAVSLSAPETDVGKNRLAALLGVDETDKVSLFGDVDRRFCRNCRNFVVHPFKSICALTDESADPMGECVRFEAKEQ